MKLKSRRGIRVITIIIIDVIYNRIDIRIDNRGTNSHEDRKTNKKNCFSIAYKITFTNPSMLRNIRNDIDIIYIIRLEIEVRHHFLREKSLQ